MKAFVFFMALVFGSLAWATTDVFSPSDTYVLIPTKAASCLSQWGAHGKPAELDIDADHIMIRNLDIRRTDVREDLVIHAIQVSVTEGSNTHICGVMGNQLKALSSHWYGYPEAVIPAGVNYFSTDCALYCGGIKLPTEGVYTGNLEILGTSRNKSGNETPVRLTHKFFVEKL